VSGPALSLQANTATSSSGSVVGYGSGGTITINSSAPGSNITLGSAPGNILASAAGQDLNGSGFSGPLINGNSGSVITVSAGGNLSVSSMPTLVTAGTQVANGGNLSLSAGNTITSLPALNVAGIGIGSGEA